MHSKREHQGRLADRFAAINRVFAIRGILDQPDVEFFGYIRSRRYLVGARRMRGEHALAVPHQLFTRQPAHALDKRAFDLAFV